MAIITNATKKKLIGKNNKCDINALKNDDLHSNNNKIVRYLMQYVVQQVSKNAFSCTKITL